MERLTNNKTKRKIVRDRKTDEEREGERFLCVKKILRLIKSKKFSF